MSPRKPAPKKTKKLSVNSTPAKVPPANGNIGELLHKLIDPGELEISGVLVADKPEKLVMKPLSYIDKIALDAHVDYMRRQCAGLDEAGRTSALYVTQVLGIVCMSLHRKLSDGRLARRFHDYEEMEKIPFQQTKQLHKLYNEYFQLSNAAKKD